VKTVQVLLNFARRPPLRLLTEDGLFGRQTQAAISEFGSSVPGSSGTYDRVEPNGAMLQALRAGVPGGFWPGQLQMIAVAARTADVQRFYDPLSQCMSQHGITTALRRAHFLAQVCHESGQLRYTEEIASGVAYEGRLDLGNTQQGAGVRFKGRGLIQLTGRANYEAFGRALGRTFNTDSTAPRLSADPFLAARTAGWFWDTRRLNQLADANQLQTITRRINGGLNGLADRTMLYNRARCAFGLA
jgi:putative chitinase